MQGILLALAMARSLATAPVHWHEAQWKHFAEGTAVVATMYVADERLYNGAQRHRSSFTNDFAKTVTPFGGRRALDISALLLISGSLTHDEPLREAGRDSLEAEIWAGGIVTPLLKRSFGRIVLCAQSLKPGQFLMRCFHQNPGCLQISNRSAQP